MPNRNGFTLIELIVVISLLSILAIYIVPRLNLDVFRETGYFQQASASIRYAQKLAIASGCQINVSINAGGCNLTWGTCGAATGAAVSNPGTGSTNFCPDSTPGSTSDLPANFSFDKIGRPSAAQSIDLGDRIIEVEAETGYTHEG